MRSLIATFNIDPEPRGAFEKHIWLIRAERHKLAREAQ
jgi:hypothetical protein